MLCPPRRQSCDLSAPAADAAARNGPVARRRSPRRTSGAAARERTSSRRWRLTDFEIRELLERAHEPRVVPRGAAVCRACREQFLARRRVGQRNAERATGGQREIQILLMQLDAKAGRECA